MTTTRMAWKPPLETVTDKVTGARVEKFTTTTAQCACCKERYHVYQFPLSGLEAGTRITRTCIACQRDCKGAKSCNLGRLWDSATPGGRQRLVPARKGDMRSAKRITKPSAASTALPGGTVTRHPQAGGRNKLNARQVCAIRRAVAEGQRQVDVAKQWAVSQPTVSLIANGRKYPDVQCGRRKR